MPNIVWTGRSVASVLSGYVGFPLLWYNTFGALGEGFGNIVFGPLSPLRPSYASAVSAIVWTGVSIQSLSWTGKSY